MSDKLNISIVQTQLHWEKIADNISHFDELLKKIENTDLIILPEMFSTGFSMKPESFAEKMDGSAVNWMIAAAKKKNACITGSLIIEEKGKYFNRLVWVSPEGKVSHYDKRHLFTMGNEQEHYAKGNEKLMVKIGDWNICPLVCYDLRFPVWARNTKPHYDLLIYVANWPDLRRHPWKTLLTARAIENQSYVVGVNRIGKDANGVEHAGDSCVIDAKGQWISTTGPYKESVETVTISRAELLEFREKFPVLNDGDDFTLLK